MKKYIREMINDLRKKNSPEKAAVVDLNPPPPKPLPDDLENQILSKNHLEEVRQLDFQAHQEEVLETEES